MVIHIVLILQIGGCKEFNSSMKKKNGANNQLKILLSRDEDGL